MVTKKANEKAQNLTPRHAKTPTPMPKLACVIMSWTAPGTQNFVAIGLWVSALRMRDHAAAWGD